MLDTATVDDVRRRLAEGQTHRHIASRLGISRDSVWRISTGRRDEPRQATGVCPRCHRSGAIVDGVCVECAARAAADERAESSDDRPEDLGLDLHAGPRQRYRNIRRRRLAIAD